VAAAKSLGMVVPGGGSSYFKGPETDRPERRHSQLMEGSLKEKKGHEGGTSMSCENAWDLSGGKEEATEGSPSPPCKGELSLTKGEEERSEVG